MSLLPAVPNLRFILKHDHFVLLALPNHISDNLGSSYSWLAQSDLIPVNDEVNILQFNDFPFGRKLLHLDNLTRGNLVLLASSFNYCVNCRPPIIAYYGILPT